MFRSNRYPVGTLGPFGFTLLLITCQFNDSLNHPLGGTFAEQMSQTALISVLSMLPVLALATFFLRKTVKSRSETEMQVVQNRLRIGYLRIARDVLLIDLVASLWTMTAMFFSHPAKTHFGYLHYVLAGVCAAITVTLVHTLWLKFQDHLSVAENRAMQPR